MSDSESDIDLRSALLVQKKKMVKLPSSPTAGLLKEPRKITTKEMILKTLTTLNTRKGVSLYAIKKYMTENFEVNTEKLNYYIKKYIKAEVEKGTIIQTKGMGASGSFRLAPIKQKKEMKIKKPKPKEKEPKPKKMEKETKKTTKKPQKTEERSLKTAAAKKSKPEKLSKKEAPKKKESKTKDSKKVVKLKEPPKQKTEEKEIKEKTSKKPKMAKPVKTPAKKRAAMLKRKSIGSIIKPPKMKPKSIKAK